MDKNDLIQRLSESREDFLDVLDSLDDADMTRRGVSGERSIKDLLAHLTLWEAQLITLLFRMGSGKKPNTAHFRKETRSEINAGWQAQHADRSLDIILADFAAIRNQTIRRLESIPARDLEQPGKYRWLGDARLRDWVLRDTVEHEQLHLAEIRRWLESR